MHNSPLFHFLVTNWLLLPGVYANCCKILKYTGSEPNTCIVDFNVSFKFKNQLHAKLVDPFFDKVTKNMLSVFEDRCKSLYDKNTKS